MKLYPHQIESLQKTKDFNKCAYYLDMGLGKTFIGSEKERILNASSTLIVCQKSKIQDWIDHYKMNYEIDIYDLTNKKDFIAFMSHMQGIAIINYELVWRRIELLKLKDFTLMLDESSLISNEKAKRSKFILKLDPKNVILLSGTPVAGKYEQLWSQCKLLGWNIKKTAFYNSYVITHLEQFSGIYHRVIDGYKNINHLKNKLNEHGCIFMKTEEVMQLPDKIDQVITVNQSKEYRYFKKNHYVQFNDVELVGDNSLTRILYERQLCGQYSTEKINAFKDILDSTNDRLIVFYNFTKELEILYDLLDRPYSIVNGSKRDLSAYEKYDNSVTFVQYQAGAMGLNLQKANKIIYFTLPLGKGSCDLWEQSKKRIHRIGQSKSCFYYYMLVKNSIEEWNLKLLQEGKELTDDLFIKNI